MTTTESPTALLRRAADRLDELLSAFPRGPVRLDYQRRRGTEVLAQLDLYGPPRKGSNVVTHKVFAPARRPEAEYAVATQPDVMRDMVGMLRSAATMAEGMANAERWHIVRHALNAARKILGEAS